MRKFIDKIYPRWIIVALIVCLFISMIPMLKRCYIRSLDTSKNWDYYPARQDVHYVHEIMDKSQWESFIPGAETQSKAPASARTSLSPYQPSFRVGCKYNFVYPKEEALANALMRPFLGLVYKELADAEITAFEYPEGTKDYSTYSEALLDSQRVFFYLRLSGSPVSDAHSIKYDRYVAPPDLQNNVQTKEKPAILSYFKLSVCSLNEAYITVGYHRNGRDGRDSRMVYCLKDPRIIANIVQGSIELSVSQ